MFSILKSEDTCIHWNTDILVILFEMNYFLAIQLSDIDPLGYLVSICIGFFVIGPIRISSFSLENPKSFDVKSSMTREKCLCTTDN